MRTTPIPLAGGSYTDESRPFSIQDTVNLRAQRTEVTGTRSPDKLQTLPGLRPFVDAGGSGVVRGAHNAEERLLEVMGSTLYRISQSGVAIPLGSVPGNGRVQIDHNQISLGNEVLVVNGSAGYLWNSVTDVFGRVTDPGFPGGSWVRFIDGYFVVIEPQGRYAASSAPAQGTQWNTLDRFTSEVSPDRLTSGGVRGSELLLLSTTSGEFFQATGNAQQPFRTKRISFKTGAPGPHVAVDADSNIFWLGSDGKFYMLNGYSPQRISYRPIEDAIANLDWSRAFAYRWDTVIYWTFPDGQTWGFDYAEREWHRRESYGLNRWRPNTMTWWNDGWIAGDFQANRLWRCDLKYADLQDGYWLEGAQEYVVRRTLGVQHDHQNRVRVPRLELVMDTGQRETVAESFAPQPDGPSITGDAPNGAVDAVYSYSYTPSGGTAPLVVALAPGSDPLPTGLTLSTAGFLSGTPTAVASYSWTVRVTDANGLYADLADSADITNQSMLVTNKAFYTGAPAALAKQTELYGFTTPHDRYRLSPTGQYVAAIDRSGTAATRLEISKYDPIAGTWSLITPPATLPVSTPRDLAWHPSGNYLTVTSVGTTAVNSMVTYKRTGDTFTPIAAPGTALIASASTVVWDSTGERLAIQQANSGERIAFYAFNAGTDTFGTKTTTPNLGADDQDFLRFDFMPGAASLYFVASGAGKTVVLAQTEAPIRTAAVASGAAGVGCYFIGSDDYVAVIGNGDLGVAEGRIFAFDSTLSAESLTLSSNFATQPSGVPVDSSLTANRRYLAVGSDTATSPQIYDFGTATVPVATKLTDPAASSGVVAFVTWGPLYE